MEVDRPTGDPATGTWERASLLDVIDVGFDPVDPGAATAVIRKGSMLLGVPRLELADPV